MPEVEMNQTSAHYSIYLTHQAIQTKTGAPAHTRLTSSYPPNTKPTTSYPNPNWDPCSHPTKLRSSYPPYQQPGDHYGGNSTTKLGHRIRPSIRTCKVANNGYLL